MLQKGKQGSTKLFVYTRDYCNDLQKICQVLGGILIAFVCWQLAVDTIMIQLVNLFIIASSGRKDIELWVFEVFLYTLHHYKWHVLIVTLKTTIAIYSDQWWSSISHPIDTSIWYELGIKGLIEIHKNIQIFKRAVRWKNLWFKPSIHTLLRPFSWTTLIDFSMQVQTSIQTSSIFTADFMLIDIKSQKQFEYSKRSLDINAWMCLWFMD